jgi:L-asparaginase II
MANPVLVEVSRGGLVESRHRGSVALVDAEGATVLALGDVERPVFPRSAVKALQALPLVETGVADAFGLSDADLALVCASHAGEPAHVAGAAAMLRKAGRDETCLECGRIGRWARKRPDISRRPGRNPARSTTTAPASMRVSSASPASCGRNRPATSAPTIRCSGRPGDAGGGDGGRPPG